METITGFPRGRKCAHVSKHQRVLIFLPIVCVFRSTVQGDHHGCPFKHFDENNLRAKLRDYGVPGNTTQEVCCLSLPSITRVVRVYLLVVARLLRLACALPRFF